jgi:hypothetical protein
MVFSQYPNIINIITGDTVKLPFYAQYPVFDNNGKNAIPLIYYCYAFYHTADEYILLYYKNGRIFYSRIDKTTLNIYFEIELMGFDYSDYLSYARFIDENTFFIIQRDPLAIVKYSIKN